MSEFNNDNISFWTDTVDLPSYPTLENDTSTEVLVVGAGITGLMNAYKLAMQGRKVMVLEANKVLTGTTVTAASTGLSLTASAMV